MTLEVKGESNHFATEAPLKEKLKPISIMVIQLRFNRVNLIQLIE